MTAFATIIQQVGEGSGTGCRRQSEENDDNSDEGDLRRYKSCLIFLRELYCIFRE